MQPQSDDSHVHSQHAMLHLGTDLLRPGVLRQSEGAVEKSVTRAGNECDFCVMSRTACTAAGMQGTSVTAG